METPSCCLQKWNSLKGISDLKTQANRHLAHGPDPALISPSDGVIGRHRCTVDSSPDHLSTKKRMVLPSFNHSLGFHLPIDRSLIASVISCSRSGCPHYPFPGPAPSKNVREAHAQLSSCLMQFLYRRPGPGTIRQHI